MGKIGVGIYGLNGHQVYRFLAKHPEAEIIASAGFEREKLPAEFKNGVRHYESLEEMLADERVSVVSICSPRRADQGRDILRCLEAGRHSYAEKPAAMDEGKLDEIIALARKKKLIFHEMAGTIFMQPYMAMRRLVQEGAIGEVVQVHSQNSYPYGEWRPQDENIDGGLLLQVGVYNLRFVEHIACRKVIDLQVAETKLGNSTPNGECRRAVSMLMKLEGGGLSSGSANYLCPSSEIHGSWGYHNLRIFGTEGYLESIDTERVTRWQRIDKDCGPIDVSEPSMDYFECFLREMQGLGKSPLSLEEELHPTRMLLRARVLLRGKIGSKASG